MFAFLPKEVQGKPFEAVFEYNGDRIYKLVFLVSIISFLITLDFLFFGNWFNKLFKKLAKSLRNKMGEWWEKEEAG
jgi:hypothetical protein